MSNVRMGGPARRVLAVAIACSLATGLAMASASGQSDPPVLLKLRHDVFDPVQRDAAVPAALASAETTQRDSVHVVQFRGVIDAAARETLERAGVAILGYVPDFAFLVRGNGTQVQDLASHPQVRWTGPWLPAYRLDPELFARFATADAAHRQVVDVVLFPGERRSVLQQFLAGRSIPVLDAGADSATGATLRLEVADTQLGELAGRPEVAWIEPHRPVHRANALARNIVGQDHIEPVHGLFGDGQMVGVGDDGLSTGNLATLHPDFDSRVAGATSTSGSAWGFDNQSAHGTHVAGTVLGSGVLDGSDPDAHEYGATNAGMAPEALLYVWALCPCDETLTVPADIYAGYLQPQYDFDPRLRTSNNSWGVGFNGYSATARGMDAFVRDHADMVVVVAAGNDGPSANTVGAPATAKNVIAVGSVDNDTAGHPAYAMSWFSSRGPVQDGRLKPDVVAPGNFLLSTSTTSGAHGYQPMAGTSMATPVVSGAAAIVRGFYQDLQGLAVPSAALVKATLINGAEDVSGGTIRLPAMDQGWGRIDLRQALVHENGRALWYYEHPGLATGESFSATLGLQDTGFPVRATLAWSDTETSLVSSAHLVNDLDLVVSGPSVAPATYTGNDRLGDALLDLDVDRLNNVEGVDVDTPAAGEWTLTVSGYNVPEGPQPFALVASGGFGPWSALTLDVSPGNASACAGASVDDLFQLQVRRHRSDLTDAVVLGLSGLPSGVAPTFSVNGQPADFDGTLSFELDPTVSAASYAVTVQADAGNVGTLVAATLTVLPLPGSPMASQPTPGADAVPRQPTLVWQPVAEADTGYRVELATDPAFDALVYSATVATTELLLPDALDLSTTYYWRITALNDCGETAGPTNAFTVVGTSIFADDFET